MVFKSGEINKDLQNAGSRGSGGGRNGFGSSNGTSSQYFASGEPYFIKQMSYGKFAYLAIESEYSYSEVKRTIEATFDAWKISGKAEYSEEIKRVLSKSTVTVFSTGDSGVESYWGTSLDNLYSMFKVIYNSNFYGYPVYTQIRSVKTINFIFLLLFSIMEIVGIQMEVHLDQIMDLNLTPIQIPTQEVVLEMEVDDKIIKSDL